MEGPPVIVEVDTIASFFGVDARDAHRNASDLAKKARRDIARAVPAPLRGEAAMSMVEGARALLDSPLAQILGEAWKVSKDLEKFCDRSLYPPGMTSEYTLTQHELALKRRPEIELVLDGAPTGFKLAFELKLALNVMSAILRIQDGRIIGARVGECRGNGKYSCSSVTLAERKTGNFRLPASISFSPGLPLARPYGR